MVFYGAVGVLNPDKETDNPDKKVCKWATSGLAATPRNKMLASKMLVEKIMEYEQKEQTLNERKALLAKGIEAPTRCHTTNVLFTNFISDWLKRKQGQMTEWTANLKATISHPYAICLMSFIIHCRKHQIA